MQPFRITVMPRPESDPIPLNSHPYVLEGALRVVVEGHEVLLQPGDSIYFDSFHSHG
jgi:mannose-6-phosphate isomerase-like protein (cupin superfamily)